MRFRNDNGDETSGGATWRQLINVADTQDTNTIYRCRFVIKETAGNGADNRNFQLEYNHEGGGWTIANDLSSVLDAAVASGLTDNADTTQQLSSPDTFVTLNAGQEESSGSAGGSTNDFVGNDTGEYEIAYSIIDADVTAADTIDIRVTGNDLVHTRASIRITVSGGAAGPDPGLATLPLTGAGV